MSSTTPPSAPRAEPSHLVRAELHSHSTSSDGALAPEELADHMAQAGVAVWSLTDHDTCAGCPSARQRAEQHGIHFLDGIEISAFHGRSVHVLGYGVDLEAIDAFVVRRSALRRERMQAMIARLQGLGVYVTMAQVRQVAGPGASLTRPHLAEAIRRGGYIDDLGQAFSRYIGEGKPAYMEQEWPSVEEAIAIIHAAQGAAVLAHPAHYGLDDEIGAWVARGLDGIEVRHPRHGRNDEERYARLCQAFGIVATASSDFHSFASRYGTELGAVELSRATLEALEARIALYAR